MGRCFPTKTKNSPLELTDETARKWIREEFSIIPHVKDLKYLRDPPTDSGTKMNIRNRRYRFGNNEPSIRTALRIYAVQFIDNTYNNEVRSEYWPGMNCDRVNDMYREILAEKGYEYRGAFIMPNPYTCDAKVGYVIYDKYVF